LEDTSNFLKILTPQSPDMAMRSIFCSAGSVVVAVVVIRVADHSEPADMAVGLLAGLLVAGIVTAGTNARPTSRTGFE